MYNEEGLAYDVYLNVYNELIKNDINIIPWVHGEIEEILNRYLKGKLIKKSTKSLSKNKNISNR